MTEQQHGAAPSPRPTWDTTVSIIAMSVAVAVNAANSLVLGGAFLWSMFCYDPRACQTDTAGHFAAEVLACVALIGALVALTVRARATRLASPYAIAALVIAIVCAAVSPLGYLVNSLLRYVGSAEFGHTVSWLLG